MPSYWQLHPFTTLATAPIYDDNHLTFRQQSLLHFSILYVTILPILCFSGWHPLHNDCRLIENPFRFPNLRTSSLDTSLSYLWKTSPQMISKPAKKDFNRNPFNFLSKNKFDSSIEKHNDTEYDTVFSKNSEIVFLNIVHQEANHK